MNVNGFDSLRGREADDLKQTGFTVIELLVVIACIAILAVTLLPALAATRPNSQSIVCLANQRQLITAWSLYARDNNDALAVNAVGNLPDSRPSWVAGWEDYTGSAADTNTAFLTNQQITLLAPYLESTRVFKCPADRSCQFGISGAPRLRSYSMNIAVGPGGIPGQDPHAKPGGSGNNSWLPWPTYKVFLKESEIDHPSHIWVLLDEDPDSINDGCFAVEMPVTAAGAASWIDTPCNTHGNGCDFAFADGHVEIHRWANGPSLNDIPSVEYQKLLQSRYIPPQYGADVRWLAERTTERSNGQPLPY